MNGAAPRLFEYDEDIVRKYGPHGPPAGRRLVQKFDPRNLAIKLMLEFRRISNEEVDMSKISADYNLKRDKIIAFRYSDMDIAPFFFQVGDGELLLYKHCNKYHTLIVTDLQTVVNVMRKDITVQKARRDGKIILHGSRIGHDEALFFEIFEKVAPKIEARLLGVFP